MCAKHAVEQSSFLHTTATSIGRVMQFSKDVHKYVHKFLALKSWPVSPLVSHRQQWASTEQPGAIPPCKITSEAISEHQNSKMSFGGHAPKPPSLACIWSYACILAYTHPCNPHSENPGYRTVMCHTNAISWVKAWMVESIVVSVSSRWVGLSPQRCYHFIRVHSAFTHWSSMNKSGASN